MLGIKGKVDEVFFIHASSGSRLITYTLEGTVPPPHPINSLVLSISNPASGLFSFTRLNSRACLLTPFYAEDIGQLLRWPLGPLSTYECHVFLNLPGDDLSYEERL